MTSQQEQNSTDVHVEVIEHEDDFSAAFACIARCFGEQTQDAVWMAMNPAWDTPEGRAAGTLRMVKRWKSTTNSDKGDPNTVHLKATLPASDASGQRTLVGVAIWTQLSMVKGLGDAQSTDINSAMDLEEILPGNESEQRFLRQVFASFVSQRVETLKEKANTGSPATFSLDLCVVDPRYQRRGIAVKLVEWGLQEAQRRGGLESTTEGSAMGRHVYSRLGFTPVKEVDYNVDAEFKDRKLPPNLFMRTKPKETST